MYTPFLRSTISNPSSCSQVRHVSKQAQCGNCGPRVEDGSRSLLTQSQKLCGVMFGFPFTQPYTLTYILTLAFKSSSNHNSGHWYFPRELSRKGSCFRETQPPSRTVRSVFPTMSPATRSALRVNTCPYSHGEC